MKHISYNRNKHINFDYQDEDSRWSSSHWAKINKHVEKLRSQIYLAKLQKNENLLRKLQNSMLNSNANILYSIRRVTSINRVARTPSPDKLLYLTPKQRYNLYIQLSTEKILDFKPSPVKRVEIPRPGKSPRPLGIPNIIDTIQQMRIKNALEPEWEAIFEHGSYGFRPVTPFLLPPALLKKGLVAGG
jgi:RNA-directed DNA polymerase